MRKLRLLINIHYLEIGGAETSLIGLLQAFDPKRVEVDLFLNDHRGEMMPFIPYWVNVLPAIPAYTMIERPMMELLCKGFIKLLIARLWAKIQFRLYEKRKHPTDGNAIFGYVGKYTTAALPSLEYLGEYDLALSFLTPHNIVLEKVKAKKKMCWIHTDYTNIDVNEKLELPVWNGYDHIASISEEVTHTFCQIFPSLREKIVLLENIISPKFVWQRALEEPQPADMPKEEDGITLLTIGRYCFPKKLDEIPAICRRLVEKGHRIKWYIIGYGGDGQYIRDAISKEGMEEHVSLLGKRTNPYPYILACNWYVQPSRYEGKSVVVREAQILQKPVIVTAYPTAASQVKDGVDGVIVPMPVAECAASMSAALNDKELKSELTAYLSKHDYGNMAEADKIYSLAGENERTVLLS